MSTKWNFFEKITVSETSFSTDPQVSLEFHTQGFVFYNEGGTVIDYSFNGSDIHGTIAATTKKQFSQRAINTIWFQAASGSPVIRVEAWANIRTIRSNNFYEQITADSTSFPTTPQIDFTFNSRGFKLINSGGTAVEYSFDGETLNGELDPGDNSAVRLFEDRLANKIWFRSPSGSNDVEVEGW